LNNLNKEINNGIYMLKFSVLITAVLLTLVMNGCGSVDVTSKWSDSFITIDGVDDEWQNSTYYIKEHNLVIGIKNDEENFYFALITNEESNKAQILRGGLTLWIDNEGGGDKKFGIRFPTGMKEPVMAKEPGLAGENAQVMPKFDFSSIGNQFTDIEIIGPDENDLSLVGIDAAKGISVKMKMIDDKLVYEFKIALKKKDPSQYAIDIKENNMFSLGIETTGMKSGKPGGDMPDGEMPPGGGGGMPPGGGGGMPPGGGGPGGGMGPGGRPGGAMEPLSYWLNVTLAHK
jgi:hypothetical protein